VARHSATTAVVASSGAPAPGTTPAVTTGAGSPPQSDGLAREASARWLDDGGGVWQWRLGVISIGTGKDPIYKGF
jgi:hypothetical protein